MQTCANLLRDLLISMQQESEEGAKLLTPLQAKSEESPEQEDHYESMDFPRTSGLEEPI